MCNCNKKKLKTTVQPLKSVSTKNIPVLKKLVPTQPKAPVLKTTALPLGNLSTGGIKLKLPLSK